MLLPPIFDSLFCLTSLSFFFPLNFCSLFFFSCFLSSVSFFVSFFLSFSCLCVSLSLSASFISLSFSAIKHFSASGLFCFYLIHSLSLFLSPSPSLSLSFPLLSINIVSPFSLNLSLLHFFATCLSWFLFYSLSLHRIPFPWYAFYNRLWLFFSYLLFLSTESLPPSPYHLSRSALPLPSIPINPFFSLSPYPRSAFFNPQEKCDIPDGRIFV